MKYQKSMTESKKVKILLIEACNFVNAPQGGQLTVARMLMKAFGNQMALCGWTDDPKAPLGVWHKRTIDGIVFDFIATACVSDNKPKRPFLPARLMAWWQFKRHAQAILSRNSYLILTREPSAMMALPFREEHRVCYWFPGIEPALSVSRYGWAKLFAAGFDRQLNTKLHEHASVLLAAADAVAITSLRQRANGILDKADIRTFPTRVDTAIFCPLSNVSDRARLRNLLHIPMCAQPLIVTSGRLHRAKGWPLLLAAFIEFCKRHPQAHLVFVGDGSDRKAVEQTIHKDNLDYAVSLAGFQPQEKLAAYLQCADLFVMGSEKEGWCTSLIEALACGLPIVTTAFSSANSIVCDGVNGFVVERDPTAFRDAMEEALKLPDVQKYSRAEISKYSLEKLKSELETLLMA